MILPEAAEAVKSYFYRCQRKALFHREKSRGSLLNDGDREVFKSLHMELAPTARERRLYPEILSVSYAF